MPPVNYVDLGEPDGQENNMGGTQQVIYYAPIRDFLSIKTVAAAPTTPEEAVDITTTHTFKTGFCFKKLYCTLDKGTVEIEPQGERDGRSFKVKSKIFYPGAKSDAMGLAALIKNDKLIVVVPLTDGKNIQIGSEALQAEMVPKFTAATNGSGLRGWEFDIESMAPVPYVYKGTISLVPA